MNKLSQFAFAVSLILPLSLFAKHGIPDNVGLTLGFSFQVNSQGT